jgi:hypothetical protein
VTINRRSILRFLGIAPAIATGFRFEDHQDFKPSARQKAHDAKQEPYKPSWTLIFEELAGLQDHPLTQVREQNAAIGATTLAESTESERGPKIVTVRSALPCATIEEAVFTVQGWLDAIGSGHKSRKCLTKIDLDIERIPTHQPGTFRLLWAREQRTSWESAQSDTPSRVELLTYVNGINITVLSIVERPDSIPVWQLQKDFPSLREARNAFDAIYAHRYVRGSLRLLAHTGETIQAGKV